MKSLCWLLPVMLALLLVGCSQPGPSVEASPPPPPTPTLPLPGVNTTQAPDVESAARAYLEAWKADDYTKMYAMLTSVSQDALTEEEFAQIYSRVATEAALSSLDPQILSSLTQTRSAQVSYRVNLHSALVGDIVRDTLMNLSLEDGKWRVQWDETLILPELGGGNTLRMDRLIPSRANIYDRDGQALVAQADATALGVFPDQIDPDQENTLLSELWRLTGLYPDNIHARYENFPPGAGWYLPLLAVPADLVQQREGVLSGLAGLVLSPFRSRFYFDGGIAPHVIGYVSAIPAEEVGEY